MEFEKLSLEVSAAKAGLTAVRPRLLRGSSGVLHGFDLVFTDGSRSFAFDCYDSVGEVEVLRSFAKKSDLGASVSIVCRADGVSDGARRLGLEYGMRILNPAALESYFDPEKVAQRRSTE